MAASIKWTKAALEKLAAHVQGAKSSNYEITDPQTAGLKLQVGTTGRKFFWFRYTSAAIHKTHASSKNPCRWCASSPTNTSSRPS